jgi:HK97 family phage portal protein
MLERVARVFGAVSRPGRSIASDESAALFATGTDTASGVRVSPETALGSTAVLACVRNIAEDMAKLPLHLMRVGELNGRRIVEQAKDHALYWLLYNDPNPFMTSFEFVQWLEASMLVYGYGVAEIERWPSGEIRYLWPLHSRTVEARAVGGNIFYQVTWEGEARTLRWDQVLHIPGFSAQGLLGHSLVKLGAEAIGLDIGMQKYAGKVFSSGGAMRGALSHPKTVSNPERLRSNWGEVYGGLENAHRVAILEEGMTFTPIGVNPKDAQAIEGRTFQIGEVCRIFRMQPHKVFELTRATFSNIEHQAIENSQDTLLPHVRRWEQRLDKCLLLPSERKARNLYTKFNLAVLLRGDSKAQAEFLKTMVDTGIYSINMALEYLDENPIEGGDEHRVALNTAPIGSAAADGEEGEGA